MLASEYNIKYICPECKATTTHSSYGCKSEIFKTLMLMIKPNKCVLCARNRRNVTMEILKVKCKTSDPNKGYRITWRCNECCTIWEAAIFLKANQNSAIISKDFTPTCVNPRCSHPKGGVYMSRMSRIEQNA